MKQNNTSDMIFPYEQTSRTSTKNENEHQNTK